MSDKSPWKATPSKICGVFVVLFGTLLFFQLGLLMLCIKQGAETFSLLVVSFGGGLITLLLTVAIGLLMAAFMFDEQTGGKGGI